MNVYTLGLVALLLAEFLIETSAELLNLSRLNLPLPQEFKSVFDEKKYLESQRYQKTQSWFGILRESAQLLAFILFLILGGFALIDQLARNWADSHIYAEALLFAAFYSTFRGLLTLPFSIYHTFVIEEKFGFNQMSWKTYLGDQIKGILLGSILGGAVFCGLIYFFEKTGERAWIYAWIAVTVFQLFLQFLAPVLILPLFNKFDPLPSGNLRTQIEQYAKAQSFPLKELFTMDGSKRSTKANAFFTGFGKFRRLVLFDTLVSKQLPDELTAVVAHEIGHFKCRHIPKFTVLGVLTSGLLFYVLSLLLNRPELFSAFRMDTPSVYGSIVLVGILLAPLSRFFSLITHFYSRKFEFEADDYSVKTYGKAESLISALKKLSADSLSHLTPHPFKVALDYTHPPVMQRIAAIRRQIPGT